MAKWTDYTTDTNPTDTDEVMTLDADKSPKANKRVTLSTLADYFLDKLASKVFAKLETQNKTVIGALNELNSNSLGYILVAAKVDGAPLITGNIFAKNSIDTGVRLNKKNIVPLNFVIADRAGYKAIIWDYVGQFDNYLIDLGEGTSGTFSGTFYYLLKK